MAVGSTTPAAMQIDASTISGNSAPYGGGIYNIGMISISASTIAGNSASSVSGGIQNDGTLTIVDSTISGNSGRFGGGGINNGQTLTVVNSTISGNSCQGDGGGIADGGSLTVICSTIAYNSVATKGEGGGLSITDQGTAALFNTIVALNTAIGGQGATADDISLGVGEMSPTSANNLVGTGGSGGLTDGRNGNLVGVADPGLGPLADNGGPTQTVAPLPGSPATGAGSVVYAVDPQTHVPLATDQRGPGFPRRVSNLVDIGAFELQPAAPPAIQLVVTQQPTGQLTAGDSFDLTVEAKDPSGMIDSSYNGPLSVALARNPGGSTLGGMLTATANQGAWTFSGLILDKAAAGYTLVASGNPGDPTISPWYTDPFDVVPGPATQLGLTSPQSSYQDIRVGSQFRLVVAAEDQFGNLNPGFDGDVSASLLDNPGGSTLGGMLTATANQGIATFSGLTLDKPGTGYTLKVSGVGLNPMITDTFDVTAAGTIFAVNSLSDSGSGTGPSGDLRYVITQADRNPGSTIEFGVTGAIVLSSELPELSTSLDVVGPAASALTVARSSAAGTPAFRVFMVPAGVEVVLSGLTITGGVSSAGNLSVSDSTISGNSIGTPGGGLFNDMAGKLTISGCTISGNSANGGGGIDNQGSMTITTSTIEGNSASTVYSGGALIAGGGGGIDNQGTLTISDSTISSNVASGLSNGNGTVGETAIIGGSGGGIYNAGTLTLIRTTIGGNSATTLNAGGGIFNAGAMSVSDSTISGNTASGGHISFSFGGGVLNSGTLALAGCTISGNSIDDSYLGGGSGAGVFNSGVLSVADATISGNSVGGSPVGGSSGAGISNDSTGSMSVVDSTISGNSAGGGFGGGGFGGGIENAGALSITNTTITGNSAGGAQGFVMPDGSTARGGGIDNSGKLQITDATIVGNSVSNSFVTGIKGGYVVAGLGGGLYGGGTVNLTGTLVAANTTSTSRSEIQGSVAAISSHNLISEGTGLTGIRDGTNGNLIGTASAPIDPLLGPLADNGGPTLTIALLSGSPAIDAGISVLDVTTDQRGVPRPQGYAPDIGAFESPYSQAATVLNLQRYGVHLHPTTLVVTFSLPMDQASAQALTNYLLVSAGPDDRFGTKDDHDVRIRSVQYAAATQTVTLLPIHRLLLRGIFRLTIKGTSPSGLKSVSGLFLDGSGKGPGTNYVGLITARRLVPPIPHSGGEPARNVRRLKT